MKKINKNLIIGALFILVVVFGFIWYIGENKSVIDESLKCTQLYELKKAKYWNNEIGQSKSIFNKDLNTCLALNIYNNPISKKYFGMVMDMSNDKTLLYYSSTPNGFYFEGESGNKKITCEYSYDYLEYLKSGEEVKEYGCEKTDLLDKMFTQIRGFGFEVFDGISNQ